MSRSSRSRSQKQRRLLLGLGRHVDTRVGDVSALLYGDSLGDTPGVLVEHDVLVVLDELKSASFYLRLRVCLLTRQSL